MARPRMLSDEERLAHVRASKAAWRQRNREACKVKEAAYRALPGRAEQKRAYRCALYRAQRQALLDSGFVPNPVGRPRLRTPEEAAEIHRTCSREYMRRQRLLLRSSAEHPEPEGGTTDAFV